MGADSGSIGEGRYIAAAKIIKQAKIINSLIHSAFETQNVFKSSTA